MTSRIESPVHDPACTPGANPAARRERILKLVKQVPNEASTVALLHIYHLVMGIAVQHMESGGVDEDRLRKAISADRQGFAVVEAMLDGFSIAPTTINWLVDREVTAGRMRSSEVLLNLNAVAASVLR